MSEKIIRDPVHDVIAFRLDRDLDALLFRLLAAPEIQRLRRIRQLGMASLAYPGADHSRYSHSLGVMETARKALDQLAHSFTIDQEGRAVCTVAALLHDLGHGPFSHVFERVSGIHHEEITRRVILDPDSGVHQVLLDHDRALPAKIVAFLRCEPRRTFFCDIISSQLDADRFDYLLRDNLMTGSRYGGFDLEWVLHALTIDQSCDRLAVHAKGISAVETYLQARFNMYRNVYFHKVVRSAEGMVKLALQRAKRLAVQRRLEWPRPGDGVYKALLGQQMSMAEFGDTDDVSVMHSFKLWSHGADPVLAALCKGLLFRRVYKSIDLSRFQDPKDARAARTAVERMIADAGGEPGYEMFYDQPAGSGYETFAGGEDDDGCGGGVNEILVKQTDGKLTPFASISPLSQALNRQLQFRRLHVAPAWRDRAEQIVRATSGG
ncbi:MAG TPA: HD domain-containing protein [Tepidisphaeraceae bacterium]|nr:HD domain-containing protein [Tepidisphaeraceae bacterium]